MSAFAEACHAIYRIIFHRGSPARLNFTLGGYYLALVTAAVAGIAAGMLVYDANPIQIGVGVFVGVSTLAIAGALLSAKAPRARLQPSMLAILFILVAALLGLIGFGSALKNFLPQYLWIATLAAVVLMVLGFSNSVQFALRGTRLKAVAYTIGTLAIALALSGVLSGLLEIVFA